MDISTIFDAVKLKIFFLTAYVFFIAGSDAIYAQQIDSGKAVTTGISHSANDTFSLIKKKVPKIKKKVAAPKKDSIKNTSFYTSVGNADTLKHNTDTVKARMLPGVKTHHAITDSLLLANKFINVKDKAVLFVATQKKPAGKEFVFYLLCALALILGLFKTFYRAYFHNIFRVFFNTSIRQSQLTDQLLQAKLPSFILNIFFSISAGIYVWLMFKSYHAPKLFTAQWLLPFCIVGISAVYFIKFCVLKFIGWLSEMQQAANDYIFVIFLVNKIAGIVLVPFIILLAFAMPSWVSYLTTLSLLITGLFFLSRYLKTYSLLEYKFPLRLLHFLIYILAIEVVPLLLIYKVVVDYVI